MTICERFGIAALIGTLLVGASQLSEAQEQAPQCRNLRYRSNFRLNGAQQYINQAEHAAYADQKQRALGDATRVLTEATQDRSADAATLWYLFGRVYALRDDLAGADTAWSKAEAETDPECRREISRQRYNLWVPLVQQGTELMASQRYDSALAVFRRANLIFRDDPAAFINMASAFLAEERADSAVKYYRLAAHAGNDPRRAEIRATALFNAARLLQRNSQFMAAESVYREYAALRPNDVDGATSLAAVLQAEGREQDAARIYDSLLAHADSLTAIQAFDLGVALFRQHRYPQSAQAIELGLRKAPGNRDALYNLANAYLAAEDTVRGLDAARRLVAADPLNRQSLRLLANAYQRVAVGHDVIARRAAAARDTATFHRERPLLQAYQDSTLRMVARHDSLPLEVVIQRFELRDSTATIRGVVGNRQNGERAPFVLVLEFTNGSGEVVATERVEVPALNTVGQPGSVYDFNLTVGGRGIVAYRYRVT